MSAHSSGVWSRPMSTFRTLLTSAIVGVLVGGGVIMSSDFVAPQSASAATSSAVTVTAQEQDSDVASSPLPDLAVTVSQTEDLGFQGVELTWTGGKLSGPPSAQQGGTNFLQFAQCWGEDPENPGHPDRTTCQYGANTSPGAARDGFVTGSVAPEDDAFTDDGSGFFDPTYTAISFRAPQGDPVAAVVDKKRVPGVDVNTNQYFTAQTSNEVPWAGSGRNGEGRAKFEIQTETQSAGLNCGRPVTGAGGVVTGTPCWLVIIPRGVADTGESAIVRSGLFYDSWKHSLAIKLGFKPIGLRCQIGAVERQVAGSELAAEAVASWQPTLCAQQGGSTYATIASAESDAAFAASGTAPAPLALTSRALTGEAPDSLAYAPVALTGVTIAFAVDRRSDSLGEVPESVRDQDRLPFTAMKLTPRLLAKLMTDSYVSSLPPGADLSHIGYKSPQDPGDNPANLTADPEFLAVNPDWSYQSLRGPAIASVIVPQGRSDGAYALWRYLLADDKARAFLSGTPDEYGMVVNPWFATDAAANESGVALSLPTESFPKADPVEKAADPNGGPVNLVTWRPYTNDFATSAYLVLRGDGLELGGWDPVASPPRYAKGTRNLPGTQRVLGVTSSAAADRYQVFTAELQNPAGQFVAATTRSLTAAAAAMTAVPGHPQVYEYDPTSAGAKGATTAYPLALPVYAAVNPAMDDADLRDDYAKFIEYGVTDGQTPGEASGQLPAGYAPIPEGWRDQALAAAKVVRAGVQIAPQSNSGGGSTGSSSSGTTGSFYTGSSSYASGSSAVTGTLGGAAAPVVNTTNPTATGVLAGSLVGNATPADPSIGATAAAVPAAIASGFACALALPFISRRRRRPSP